MNRVRVVCPDGLPRNTRVFIGENEITDSVMSINLWATSDDVWKGQLDVFVPSLDIEMELEDIIFYGVQFEESE